MKLHVILAFAIAALVFSAPAAASHQHWIATPAGCKEDIASGQTRKDESHPGGHKFHDNVHTGMPGTWAFARARNPVTVGRDECP
jgi:hypothetical protein